MNIFTIKINKVVLVWGFSFFVICFHNSLSYGVKDFVRFDSHVLKTLFSFENKTKNEKIATGAIYAAVALSSLLFFAQKVGKKKIIPMVHCKLRFVYDHNTSKYLVDCTYGKDESGNEKFLSQEQQKEMLAQYADNNSVGKKTKTKFRYDCNVDEFITGYEDQAKQFLENFNNYKKILEDRFNDLKNVMQLIEKENGSLLSLRKLVAEQEEQKPAVVSPICEVSNVMDNYHENRVRLNKLDSSYIYFNQYSLDLQQVHELIKKMENVYTSYERDFSTWKSVVLAGLIAKKKVIEFMDTMFSLRIEDSTLNEYYSQFNEKIDLLNEKMKKGGKRPLDMKVKKGGFKIHGSFLFFYYNEQTKQYALGFLGGKEKWIKLKENALKEANDKNLDTKNLNDLITCFSFAYVQYYSKLLKQCKEANIDQAEKKLLSEGKKKIDTMVKECKIKALDDTMSEFCKPFDQEIQELFPQEQK